MKMFAMVKSVKDGLDGWAQASFQAGLAKVRALNTVDSGQLKKNIHSKE